ncbi:MAG: sigma-54-dependent Fis family transcriptional regulator [Gammaproteobacteria bacterium]|nr:sigma-54-dependent Fis family transcriptional regulator [Gammaproteobacteria bacterium]
MTQMTEARDEKIFGPKYPTGRTEAVRQVVRLIQQVARHDSTVLILGESGAGKEVVARAIHDSSHRRGGPYVAVNCGAIPAELLESELFGHERGAFTGAYAQRAGRFEVAEGGTLFLDEIGDMSLPMQVKLLRVLQERVFERVGGNQIFRCDVRIIAATHRNLEQQIERGMFRGDLFYRLNVFPIDMPSLRERVGDLPLLIQDFIEQNVRAGRARLVLAPAALESLRAYAWPGNVRELGNLIERLCILYPDRAVELDDLPLRYRSTAAMSLTTDSVLQATTEPQSEYATDNFLEARSDTEDSTNPIDELPQDGLDLRAHLCAIESRLIHEALQRSGGTVAHAARLLGLRRTTLVEKLRRNGVSEASLV